jgi:hypothetical protein
LCIPIYIKIGPRFTNDRTETHYNNRRTDRHCHIDSEMHLCMAVFFADASQLEVFQSVLQFHLLLFKSFAGASSVVHHCLLVKMHHTRLFIVPFYWTDLIVTKPGVYLTFAKHVNKALLVFLFPLYRFKVMFGSIAKWSATLVY